MKKANNIYYLGIILLTIKMWFFITDLFETNILVDNLFTISITALFAIKIFFTRSSYKEFIILCMVGIFIFITSQRIFNIDIFLSVLSILAAKDIDIKKAVKYIFRVNATIIAIHVAYFAFCYIFEPHKIVYIIDDELYRYTFFMRHPNYLGATLLWTLAAYIYMNYEKKKKNIFLIILVSILAYITSKSRTTWLAFMALGILILMSDKIKQKTLARMVNVTFVLAIGICLFVATQYYQFSGSAKTFIDELNTMLSGRIKLSAIGMETYGYTFLGQHINTMNTSILEMYGIKKLIIDSFYISCCINYGIFYLILIGYGLIKLGKMLEKKELLLFLLFIIVALTERYVIYSTLVFPLLFFAELYNKKRKDNST